jgi:hypothetical protein
MKRSAGLVVGKTLWDVSLTHVQRQDCTYSCATTNGPLQTDKSSCLGTLWMLCTDVVVAILRITLAVE